ncbi:MAG: hypothetical protein JW709_04575 [Sedimentisphaerales bacterium]|nr:hypothetical protein [Sedimentisphaerales bacterium]
MNPTSTMPAKTITKSRRRTIRRRFWLLMLLVVVLCLAVLVIREPLAKQELLSFMDDVGQHIIYFQTTHKRLPTQNELLSWKIYSRNAGLESLDYAPTKILPDSPEDTILLAMKEPRKFHFIQSGHAVLQIDGQVKWLTPEQLAEKLRDREKHYNAAQFNPTQ